MEMQQGKAGYKSIVSEIEERHGVIRRNIDKRKYKIPLDAHIDESSIQEVCRLGKSNIKYILKDSHGKRTKLPQNLLEDIHSILIPYFKTSFNEETYTLRLQVYEILPGHSILIFSVNKHYDMAVKVENDAISIIRNYDIKEKMNTRIGYNPFGLY